MSRDRILRMLLLRGVESQHLPFCSTHEVLNPPYANPLRCNNQPNNPCKGVQPTESFWGSHGFSLLFLSVCDSQINILFLLRVLGDRPPLHLVAESIRSACPSDLPSASLTQRLKALTERLEAVEAKVQQQVQIAVAQANPSAQALPAADQPQAVDPAPEAPPPHKYPAQDPVAQGPPHIPGIPYVSVAAPTTIKVKDPKQFTGNRLKAKD